MIQSHIAGYSIGLPTHRHQFHLEHPEWHKAWLDSIRQTLKPDDVVVDVGAEQGDLSALVASWVPDGGVWLVEPVAKFWPTIRTIFEVNGLEPLGSFVGFASDEQTGVKARRGFPAEAHHRMVNEPGFQHLNERADLPAGRLEDLIPDEPSAVLIDVEGAELKVLHGTEMWLIMNRPHIWCAVHPESMRDRYGHDPNDLLAYMAGFGYRWDFLGFQGESHFHFYHP